MLCESNAAFLFVAKHTTKRSGGPFLVAMHPEEAASGRFCRFNIENYGFIFKAPETIRCSAPER